MRTSKAGLYGSPRAEKTIAKLLTPFSDVATRNLLIRNLFSINLDLMGMSPTAPRKRSRILADQLEPRLLFATISGAVFLDRDGDGRIAPSEPSLTGIQVYLDTNANDVLDAGESATVTTENGYSFTVPAGTYRVAQVQDPNGLRTFPGTGRMLLATGGLFGSTTSSSNALSEINPLTGALSNDTGSVRVESSSAVSGNYVYTFASGPPGGPSSIGVAQVNTGSRGNTVVTSASGSVASSVILDDELYLRLQNSTSVMVVDLSTGTLRRTITLPAGTGTSMAAMPDRHALFVATPTTWLVIDPQTGNSVGTLQRPGTPSALPHLAYLNGTAYAQWSDSSFATVSLNTGLVTSSVMLATPGTLVSNESPSHLVTVAEGGVAVASFARVSYSPAADVPVLLSTNGNPGSNLAATARLAISGTVAGATVSIFHPFVSFRDRKVLTVTATQGTTYVDLTYDQILYGQSFGLNYGFGVYQTVADALPQRYIAITQMLWSGNAVAISVNATPGSTTGYVATGRPTFGVAVQPTYVSSLSTVEIYANGQRIATKPFFSNPTQLQPDQALADGVYQISGLARQPQTRPGATFAWQGTNPATFSLTIDRLPPTASVSYAVDAAKPAIRLAFDAAIQADSTIANAVTVEQIDPAGVVIATLTGTQLAAMLSADAKTLSLTRSDGQRFGDGLFRVRFNTTTPLRDRAGNTIPAGVTSIVRVLAGDANQDGTVNFDDLIILAQNYNATGKTFAQGNFDYSAGGEVNFDDLIILAQRYNTTLALPPAAMLATPAATAVSGKKIPHGRPTDGVIL